ncbi:hypothetical protein AZE42_05826 [Rhizopogon vesiculosus]|uniref:Uncharacterized protein n=1 Tax=Rhizopogon vesiculosus TaxID=180088 RepID=A0A1J8QC78_9AGAM|nr:hypothetical protein AZE42_05826 [Rhizopogon vesiculosus]
MPSFVKTEDVLIVLAPRILSRRPSAKMRKNGAVSNSLLEDFVDLDVTLSLF